MDVFFYWYILATPVPAEVTPMSMLALAWAALLLLCNHITPQKTSTSNATTSPQSKPLISHNEGSRGAKSAIIFLHGLGPALSGFCKTLLGPRLGLKSDVLVKCPEADLQQVAAIPDTFIPGVLGSWFNFWLLPAISVVSPVPGESKDGLEAAMRRVEAVIQELGQEGVASENIVLSGISQGGALTLYTAVNTEYNLGGFVAIVAWMPLLNAEPSSGWQPANKDTPIFLMNGLLDLIVPVLPAGSKTSEALGSVFSRFTYKNVPGTHTQ